MSIVCIGESVVDFVPDRGGRECYRPRPGGSPLNVAVGLARLGVPAHFMSDLSTDLFGDLLENHLRASAVGLLTRRVDRPSTLAFVSLGEGDPTYAFFDEGSAGRLFDPGRRETPADTALLHAGSYSLAVEPCGTAIERLVSAGRRRGLLVSLDVNIRARLVGDRATYAARLGRLFRLADIVKASAADLAWSQPGVEPERWASDRIRDGAALAVVTLGGEGAIAATRAGTVAVTAPAVDVIDTVGAGDAFMAGLLAGMHARGLLVREGLGGMGEADTRAVMRLASAAGTFACTRAGADPGSRADIEAFMGERM